MPERAQPGWTWGACDDPFSWTANQCSPLAQGCPRPSVSTPAKPLRATKRLAWDAIASQSAAKAGLREGSTSGHPPSHASAAAAHAAADDASQRS